MKMWRVVTNCVILVTVDGVVITCFHGVYNYYSCRVPLIALPLSRPAYATALVAELVAGRLVLEARQGLAISA